VNKPVSRRRASALQDALERYEAALAQGAAPEAARQAISAELGPDVRAFLLAVALPEVAAPTPEPAFAEAFAAKLRSANYEPSGDAVVLRPRFAARVAPLTIAACTIAFAALLMSAFNSLPGDNLYALKGASEGARVWFATGADEAVVRVDIANDRFGEVEELLRRNELSAMGPGIQAASALEGIDDPELAQLIEEALADAGRQLEKAAEILSTYAVTSQDLDGLVDTSRRGQELASLVADELPNPSQPPVVRTVVKLAKIEAEAKAAQMKAEAEEQAAEPTLAPCETPTPEPTAEPTTEPVTNDDQTSSGSEPELTPGIEETPEPEEGTDERARDAEDAPEPEATSTPGSTPCASPSPTPEPTETPEPESTPEEEPAEPTPAEEGSEGVDAGEDEQSQEVDSDGSASEA
jgi:hypothetical protein